VAVEAELEGPAGARPGHYLPARVELVELLGEEGGADLAIFDASRQHMRLGDEGAVDRERAVVKREKRLLNLDVDR